MKPTLCISQTDRPPRPRPAPSQLYLDYNCIGDKGAEALAAALGRAGAPQLKRLCLGSNAIGEGGVGALDAALLRRAAMIGDESMLARRGQTRRSLERRAGCVRERL